MVLGYPVIMFTLVQDLTALKVISPGVPGDILLAEAIFVNNSKIRRDTRLTPFQLVTAQQSTLPPLKDTGEHTHHSLNRLKHLGVQVPDNLGGDLQEVMIYDPISVYALQSSSRYELATHQVVLPGKEPLGEACR